MKRILVCTDGSPYSQVCCEYAAWFARKTGVAIEVLYVTDLRQFEVPLVADLGGSLGIQPYQAVLSQLQELEEKKAKVILTDAQKIFEQQSFGGDLVTTHRTGLLVDSLQDQENKADMIFLGKRGENANFATEHLGSTMERVVRASRKPCFVTSRKYEEITSVLLAYDGSNSTRTALSFLLESPAMLDVDIHIVSVVEGEQEEKVLSNLREAETLVKAKGRECACHMLHGAVEDEISNYVQENNIKLLAMGAYGHSRIRYLIIGSTTAEMIRSCRIPVLLFR